MRRLSEAASASTSRETGSTFSAVADTAGAYPKRVAITKNASSSDNEPLAMLKKRINSTVPFRAHPSAMFAGTDTAARRICIVRPKRPRPEKTQ